MFKGWAIAAYLKFKESVWIHLLLILTITLYPRLRYFFHLLYSNKGLPRAYDTEWYMNHAVDFIENLRIEPTVDGVFYFSYYSLLSILILVFKSETAIVFFQILVNTATVILVYRICTILFNPMTGLFGGLLYAYTWPLISWSIFIVTDSLFISLLILNVYFLLKAYKTGKRVYKVSFFIGSIYMLFFRPTGMITLFFMLIYILINSHYSRTLAILKKNRVVLSISTILLAAISVIALSNPKVKLVGESFYNYLWWLLEENYSKGQIFDVPTRHDYSFKPNNEVNFFNDYPLSFLINNWYHILVLYVKRAVYFWAFSLGHFTIYKFYFIIVYAFGAAGFVGIIKDGLFKRASILFFVVLSIMVFCIVFFMDSAYRYRVPALVFSNLIAAYGISRTLEKIEGKFLGKREVFRNAG